MKFLFAFILALAIVSVIFARTEEEACPAGICDSKKKVLKCVARWSCQPNERCADWSGGCVPDHTAANTCRLPLEPGPCSEGFQVWGFNSKQGQCEQFTYGGCQGNGNRFESIRECENRCLMV
ncbi:kunitz-type serine protease inhibitor kunitoxin-Phi1-like [Lineus longissimus]|uniref:kunitz-type serine protease inhibitor kunitoxin-Phi1-like n=1 Tax=Lineus longissimus TaxID=88925 RepID=UPI002B4CB1ED